MKIAMVTAPGTTQVVDAPKPEVGPTDVLARNRACGICGSDALYIAMGGLPPHEGKMPLGHVTPDVIANWEKYAVLISHTFPFENVEEALRTAATPGAADKVVVTFA